MRILFVIPHYFGSGPTCYGSTDVSKKKQRAASLEACIASLYQQFGRQQNMLLHDGLRRSANRVTSVDLNVVVCVRGDDHLLNELDLPEGSFQTRVSAIVDPRYLGYVCFDVFKECYGTYDWYCFLEDDIVVGDPLFFCKLQWFYSVTGNARYLLQPNRFEVSAVPALGKSYVDGPLWQDSAEFMESLRLPGCREEIHVPFGDEVFRILPAENPHSGCFFLTGTHLDHMLEQPWYGERLVGYAGPLESAATLYITTLFHVFKPSDECASFLEVHHHYQKFERTTPDAPSVKSVAGGMHDATARSLWFDDLLKPGRREIHESWFRTDTIDYWRHERMYEAVFKCLAHTRASRWLTVGDGRYGMDAIRMQKQGFQDVTATDLDDTLLKLSYESCLLQKIGAENAEKMSFGDNTFDYVLCKESFHHFTRPMLALYEMIRVACKAVVLIEPQDPYGDFPLFKENHIAVYEEEGNYIYTLSRRELEKVALGLRLPAVAFKNICDIYVKGVETELAIESNPLFVNLVRHVKNQEASCSRAENKHNMMMAVLFIETPDDACIQMFNEYGWSVEMNGGLSQPGSSC
jgi:SAM-dependent methyltransferase